MFNSSVRAATMNDGGVLLLISGISHFQIYQMAMGGEKKEKKT